MALMFCATGAAVATSSKTQSAGFGQRAAALASPQPAAASPDALRARHNKEIAAAQAVARDSRAKALAHDVAVVRATTVARGVQRKKLAARAAEAKAGAAEAKERAAEAKQAALAHNWQLPVTNPVKTSGFGYRWGRLHAGEDFAVSVGTPLASMSTGTVDFAGPISGYGVLVRIRYWDGTMSYYGHMSSVSVNKGDSVDPGEIVGRSGNTGRSTGPHLHLEIHPNGGDPVDPGPWLERRNIAS